MHYYTCMHTGGGGGGACMCSVDGRQRLSRRIRYSQNQSWFRMWAITFLTTKWKCFCYSLVIFITNGGHFIPCERVIPWTAIVRNTLNICPVLVNARAAIWIYFRPNHDHHFVRRQSGREMKSHFTGISVIFKKMAAFFTYLSSPCERVISRTVGPNHTRFCM